MPTTHKNTVGGGTTSIMTDLTGTPVAGDTIELVQGQQAYSASLNALDAIDLAAFIQQPSSLVSLGHGNSAMHIDAALIKILGGGMSYAIRGGAAASHDRMVFHPANPLAVGFFSSASCPVFEAMAGSNLQVLSSYTITAGYISHLVGSLHLEAGGTNPTALTVAGRVGGGPPVKLLLGRSPTTLNLHAGSACELTTDTAAPTTLNLLGGRFEGRGPAPGTITGGGVLDLRKIRTAFTPGAWTVNMPTLVYAPPANGYGWTEPSDANIHAPFTVVPFGQAG